MGSYCKFCGQRCFVVRVVPDGDEMGWTGCMATCAAGMAHDLKVTGHTHETAINPATAPEAARAVADAVAEARRGRCPDGGYCHGSRALAGSPPCPAGRCFRVRNAGPLSGVFPGDRWPATVLADTKGEEDEH